MENTKLNKTVFKRKEFDNTINTDFIHLKTSIDLNNVNTNLEDIENFFTLYNNIFYNIPKLGDINSHEFIIKKSNDYVNLDFNNEEIQALLDEISTLKKENLDLKQSKQAKQT